MKNTERVPVRQPDRVLSYFENQRPVLAVVTVSGLIYNLGLVAGPWFEGQLAQCLLGILNGNETFAAMAALCAGYLIAIAVVQGSRFIKRLYVRPAFRGRGIAGAMMQRILDDARAIGYTAMLLDTLPFLTSAIRMYRALGFYDIPPYNDSPLDTTIFLRLDL